MNNSLETSDSFEHVEPQTFSRWPDKQSDVTVSRKIATPNEEDSLLRWPWIPYILENGNLFFIEPYIRSTEGPDEKETGPLQIDESVFEKDENKKIPKGLGKLKEALLRKKTLPKGDKDVDLIREKLVDEREINRDNGWKRKVSTPNNNTIGIDKANIPNGNVNGHRDENSVHLVRKTVIVKLQHNVARRNTSLLESRLGIIAVLPKNGQNIVNGVNGLEKDSDAIVIQDVLSSGPCSGVEEIKSGCKLVAVNGAEVSLRNIDSTLARLYEPCEVVLVIEESVVVPAKPKIKNKLLDLICGVPEAKEDIVALKELACVAYLTLDCNEDDKDGDILFWYPDTKPASKLKAIRGMFLTLGDLMDSVTGTPVRSSTLTMEGKIVHICYAKERSNVLVIAVPDDRCSLPFLEQSVEELEKLLCLLYGSLESTFKESDLVDVEHLIMLFMERILGGLPVQLKTDVASITSASFCGTRQLCLSSQHKVWISNTLSDAEAADYGECADDFFPHRRLYSTLGTCLFYKGHLVCNHLGGEDTVDFLLYCKYYCLLLLNEVQKVNQMVIWREIFPRRKRKVAPKVKGSFEEPSGRWYLLAVSQKQSLLCMLLEAGGIASMPQGNPGPHPYYVDTAASILAYMQEHFDFETICEARLRAPSVPALASLDETVYSKSGRQSPVSSPVEIAPRKLPAHLQHMAGRTPVSPFEQVKVTGNFSMDDSPLSSVASPALSRRQSSLASEDSSSGSGSYQRTTVSGSAASVRKSMAGGISGEFSAMVTTKLTAGTQNILFYYASLDTGRGILICPNSGSTPDNLEKEVLHDFRKACETIREQFRKSQRRMQMPPQKNGAINMQRSHTENDQLLEQGVLFRHRVQKSSESKKQGTFVRYWVVGRCLPRKSQQLFVCFRDGIPQNVIELGFKLGFGAM